MVKKRLSCSYWFENNHSCDLFTPVWMWNTNHSAFLYVGMVQSLVFDLEGRHCIATSLVQKGASDSVQNTVKFVACAVGWQIQNHA
jgi:hypothetical protein